MIITDPSAEQIREAQDAVRRDAFTVRHGCEYCDHECSTRPIIHTIAGGFGADWDLQHAVDFIAAADSIEWLEMVHLDHNLAVRTNGRTVLFQVDGPPS